MPIMADFVYTPEEAKTLLDRLSQPFAIPDVKWRVTNKTQDGKKGCVAPYADPRAYTARLNEVFTAAGWAFELSSETTVGLTRMRAGKCVPTGKVTIIATLDIFGIGKKASTGEMWADDDNAVTRAEAQAKKRAASMFGLGEYFYRFKELGSVLWVPLDDRGNPTKVPDLPGWALPAGTRPKTSSAPTANRSTAPVQQQVARPQSVQPQQTVPVVGSPQVAQAAVAQPAAVAKATPPPQQNQVHSISEPEKKFRAARKVQETILGVDLANNILEILAAKLDVGEIKGEKFGLAKTKLDAAVALLTKVREVAERTHPSVLRSLLLRYELQDLNAIPTVLAGTCDRALILTGGGALALRQRLPNSISIFIQPASAAAAAARILERNCPNSESRIGCYEQEVAASSQFDRVFLNEDFDETLDQIEDFYLSARRQRPHGRPAHKFETGAGKGTDDGDRKSTRLNS